MHQLQIRQQSFPLFLQKIISRIKMIDFISIGCALVCMSEDNNNFFFNLLGLLPIMKTLR